MQCKSRLYQSVLFPDNWDHCVFGMHTLPELPKHSLGWLFPRNSILKPLFGWFYNQKREHGIIQKLYVDQYKYKTECTDEPFNSIDFQTVTLLFVLLSVGVILAIISFAAEKYFCSTSFNIMDPPWVFFSQKNRSKSSKSSKNAKVRF